MISRCVVLCILAMAFSPPVFAQSGTIDSQTFKQVLYEYLATMEVISGSEPSASLKILESTDEEIEALFGLIKDKEGFIAATTRIKDYMNTGATALAGKSPQEATSLSSAALALTSGPFPPEYPIESGIYYEKIVGELKAVGLVSSAQDRCDSTALSDYWSIWWEAYSVATLADTACNIAGCDPTGIGCGIICASSNIAMAAVFVAQRPIALCSFHDANIDSAELQAGYENSVRIMNNLDEHDLNMLDEANATQKQIDTHDTDMKDEFVDINTKLDDQKGLLHDVLGNQQQIIDLLQTPQGKRPGWNTP